MNHILYLCIGNGSINDELKFSLASLHKVVKKVDFRVAIYTDHHIEINDKLFSFAIDVILLSKEQINTWLGTSRFLLCLKPRIILEHVRNSGANVLFVDTDTFYVRDPQILFQRIKKGTLILHLRENKLKKHKMLWDYLSSATFKNLNGDVIAFDENVHMWNSGVIGIGPSRIQILEEVLELLRQFTKQKSWHTMEQICVSYVFGKAGSIISAEKYVFHYWFNRQTVFLLQYYFEGKVDVVTRPLHAFLRTKKNKQNLTFKSLPRYSMELFVLSSAIFNWHIYSLKGSSYPGMFLRLFLLRRISTTKFLLECSYNDLLNRNNIIEVTKPEFLYE